MKYAFGGTSLDFFFQYLLIFNKNNFNCGILSRSDIVGICPVGFCPVGFCLWGFCPVGFCLDTTWHTCTYTTIPIHKNTRNNDGAA